MKILLSLLVLIAFGAAPLVIAYGVLVVGIDLPELPSLNQYRPQAIAPWKLFAPLAIIVLAALGGLIHESVKVYRKHRRGA